MAVMLVPEAAVDKHDCPVLRKHDIGPSGQAGSAEPVAEVQGVEALADLQFDLRVLAADPRHQRGTSLRADDVRHQATLRARWAGAAVCCSRCGTMIRATSAITGTTTELPNCL